MTLQTFHCAVATHWKSQGKTRSHVELTTKKAELAKVAAERDEYRKLVLHLREEVERLRRGLLGQKAERLPRNDTQLSLANLEMAFGSQQKGDAKATETQLIDSRRS
jgi:hypothetical protein